MRKKKAKLTLDPLVFDKHLASYAQKHSMSRGRKYKEAEAYDRLPFQRDRDRIIHTTSFRRLKGKMQVVPPTSGDHFRNRLTHTIEVAQIARDMARFLRLNEDLAETIALAHDLGHPPFGHAGEKVLDEKMKSFGFRFEHNEQSLRVVEVFETRYSNFPGLNLTFEVLEGMQKHSSSFERPGGEIIFSPHLEAQLVDISDEIAYLAADLEDGLRGGFFEFSELQNLALPKKVFQELPEYEKKSRPALIRRIIKNLLHELSEQTLQNIEQYNIRILADVQKTPELLVTFSADVLKQFYELKQFLMHRYYLSPSVQKVTEKGQEMISEIFDFLHQYQYHLPDNFLSEEPLERRICDYIAGMTDRFAEKFKEEIITS